MTNRTDYTDIVYQSTPQEDLETIKDHLKDMKRPVTLENAQTVLAMLIDQAPGEWALTLEQLPGLWAAGEQVVVHCPFCQAPLPSTEGYRTCPGCGAKEDEPACCDEPFFFKDDPDQGMVHYACLCGREQVSDSYIDLYGPMSVPWGGN